MYLLIPFLFLAISLAQTNSRPSNFSVYQFLLSQPINQKISQASRNVKFQNMAADTLSFYRGSPQLFSRDFIGSKLLKQYSSKDTLIWTCGDLHGANFGAFTNAKGDAVYELADFDESLILDYQYDLYRLGSYMALLGGYLGRPAEVYVGWIKLTCKTFITSYLNSISNLALNDISLNTSFTSSTTEGVLKKFLITASSKSGLDLLDSFSSTQPGTPNRQFVMDSTKGIVPLESTIKALIKKYWPHYINSVNLGGNQKNSTPLFAIKDIARRINAGLSSLGVERYFILIEGKTLSSSDDIILDMKMLMRPSSLNFFDKNATIAYERMWPRLVDEISRINASIIGLSRSYNKYLGYIAIPVFRADEMWPFYITQRTPAKSEWKPKSKTSNDDINSMAMWWGTILATQHTRADRKHDNGKYLNNSFAKAVQSASSHYSPSLIDLVIKVSTSYAGQVAADYRQFLLEVSDDHQLNDNTIEIL